MMLSPSYSASNSNTSIPKCCSRCPDPTRGHSSPVPSAAPGSPKASSSPTAAGSQASRPFRIYNAKLIQILRTNTFQSVQGASKFDGDGENTLAVAYLFQWQNGNLTPVFPATNALGTPEYPKPNWPT